jgi:hypothetical protein
LSDRGIMKKKWSIKEDGRLMFVFQTNTRKDWASYCTNWRVHTMTLSRFFPHYIRGISYMNWSGIFLLLSQAWDWRLNVQWYSK